MRGSLFVAVLAAANAAWADPEPEPPKPSLVERAEAAMQRGIEATSRSDHEAALAAFREAAQLVPDANLPHKLAGEALEALGRHLEALAAYRRYVEIKPDAKGVPEVRARIERLERERVGTLVVRCTPAGALVELDGARVGVTPLAPQPLLAPKRYALSISAVDHVPRRDDIDLRPGERTDYPCALDRIVAAVPPRPPVVAERPRWYRQWKYLGPIIGVGAAALGTGVFLAVRGGVPSSDGGAHPFPKP